MLIYWVNGSLVRVEFHPDTFSILMNDAVSEFGVVYTSRATSHGVALLLLLGMMWCLEGDDGSVLLDASRGDLSVLVVLAGHGGNVGNRAAVCFALVLEVVVQGDHDEDNTSNNSEADDEGCNLSNRALDVAGHDVLLGSLLGVVLPC